MEPTKRDYDALFDDVMHMGSSITEGAGLELLSMLGVLEESSKSILPYLAGLVEKRGSDANTYVHTAESRFHPLIEGCIDAIPYEKRLYTHPELIIGRGIEMMTMYLNSIFHENAFRRKRTER